jgi:hypothetical protein
MSSKISSSLEDEVESSLFEELEEDISQGLKFLKKRKKGKKTSSLYSPHENLNLHFKYYPTLDLNHILQKYKP